MARGTARSGRFWGRFWGCSVGLAVLALSATAVSANGAALPAPLVPYEAEYRVSRGPLTLGSSTTLLRPVAGGWEFRTVATPTGIARMVVAADAIERTLLASDGESLRTLRYEQTLPEEPTARVDFDWSASLAHIANADGESVAPLAAGTHDPHGAILSVMISLARSGAVPSFEIIDDDGDITRLHFEVSEPERLRVPFGEFEVIEVRRVREDRDRQLIAWFAPELDWIPIRIQQVRRGSTVARMDLRRFNGENQGGEEPERNRRGPRPPQPRP